MPRSDENNEILVMHNLYNRERKKLYEWLEKIYDNFCKEQVVEARTSLEEVKRKFYTGLHKGFLCSIPTLLYKFFIENGVSHIVQP